MPLELCVFAHRGSFSISLHSSLPYFNHTCCCFLSVVRKVQPQMQGVPPEVVPVAPTSQSVPVAPPQVYVVLDVLMAFKEKLNTN